MNTVVGVSVTEKFAIEDVSAVRDFLRSVGSKTQRRGREYQAMGRVKSLACVEEGVHYRATVQGSGLYTVDLQCEDGSWFTDCTCPMSVDCKHGVAAIIALSNLGAAVSEVANKARSVPASQDGPLAQAITETLKRSLSAAERQYVKRVQELHAQRSHSRSLTDWDLQQLVPNLRGHSYEPLALWKSFPSSPLEFWHYLAFALQQRGARIPEFMAPVTNIEWAAKRVAETRRKNEVQDWQQRLEQWSQHTPAATTDATASPTCCAEVRLILVGRSAALQSKADGEAEFRTLKPSRIKHLMEQYRSGQFQVSPETFPLWQPSSGFHVSSASGPDGVRGLPLWRSPVRKVIRYGTQRGDDRRPHER